MQGISFDSYFNYHSSRTLLSSDPPLKFLDTIFKMSDLNPLNGGNFVHDNNRLVDGGSILKRFSLQGKTAIVTGAAAGIGFSIAEAYAETGADIALWYRTSNKAHERAEELAKKYNVTG